MEKQPVIPVLDRQMFENNQIQETTLKDEIVFDKSNKIKQSKKPSKKRCSRGKRRNIKTNRCNKNCAPGYKRSKKNYCIKNCAAGYKRSKKNRCVQK